MEKKRKNMVVKVLGLALAGAVLTGCGESQKPRQDTQEDSTASVSEEIMQEDLAAEETEKEEAAQTAEEYEDNFAVNGEAAKAFAQKIQEAVAQKDLEALAELTAFPVYVGLPGVDVVETKEDFLKLDVEAVFTDELAESVKNADVDNLQPSMAGFHVSDGDTPNIIFSVTDGELGISGINY